MSSKRTATIAAIVLGSVLLCTAVALFWPSMLGWVVFAWFALAGCASFAGVIGITRRRTSIAFGVYMLICAVHFGLSFGNTDAPHWSQGWTTAMLLASVAWYIREARHSASGGPHAA